MSLKHFNISWPVGQSCTKYKHILSHRHASVVSTVTSFSAWSHRNPVCKTVQLHLFSSLVLSLTPYLPLYYYILVVSPQSYSLSPTLLLHPHHQSSVLLPIWVSPTLLLHPRHQSSVLLPIWVSPTLLLHPRHQSSVWLPIWVSPTLLLHPRHQSSVLLPIGVSPTLLLHPCHQSSVLLPIWVSPTLLLHPRHQSSVLLPISHPYLSISHFTTTSFHLVTALI